MSEQRFELLRSTSIEEVSATAELLTDAGVPHKVSTNRVGAEITDIGLAGVPKDILLTVAADDYQRARDILETAYAKSRLPPGHFLLSATDEDLIEVLKSSSEWSPFDVAQARKLARERGIDEATIQEHREEFQAGPLHGRKASKSLLVYGYVSAFLGGLFGIMIGYSLAYTMEQTPEGEFHRYDEATRRIGKRIMVIGVIMLGVTRYLVAAYEGTR